MSRLGVGKAENCGNQEVQTGCYVLDASKVFLELEKRHKGTTD